MPNNLSLQTPNIGYATSHRGSGVTWEEEAVDPWFFVTFSEKKDFPLGINIIVYVMTH